MIISNNVTGIDPYNAHCRFNPIGQTSPLPLEVQRLFFLNANTDLHNLALVCKEWRDLADDKILREMIRPAKAFGSHEWKEYIGVDAGEESVLPRHVYRDMENSNYYLTYIPKSVKRIQSNEKLADISKEIEEVQEILLDSLGVIGNLAANPIKGSKIVFTKESWQKGLQEKLQLSNSHWVLINKEVRGRFKKLSEQLAQAKEEKVSLSGLIDTVISIFMEYVRSKERNYIGDEKVNGHATWLQVIEQIEGQKVCLSMSSLGLDVCYFDNDAASEHLAFAPSRKSP